MMAMTAGLIVDTHIISFYELQLEPATGIILKEIHDFSLFLLCHINGMFCSAYFRTFTKNYTEYSIHLSSQTDIISDILIESTL